MSFRIGSGNKAGPAPLSKAKGGISLGGFSFKQLEEDEEEEEDLSICTGKYDKLLEESQKVQRRSREKTLSTSSNSSTSSTSGDVKAMDMKGPDKQRDSKDAAKLMKPMSSDTQETSSPLRKQAKAKLESSKEMFSDLKGRISTSGDVKSMDMKGPDKQRDSKDAAKVMKPMSSDTQETSSPLRKQAKAKLESSKEMFSGLKGRISDKISKTIEEFSSDSSSNPSPDIEKIIPLPDPVEKSSNMGPVVAENANLLYSASPVTEHPLVLNNEDDIFDELEDVFKDFDEDTISVASTESANDGADALVFQEIYANEPFEDFTGAQGLATSTKMKSRSKLKRLINKNTKKTSASASMSGLACLPDQSAVSSSSDSGIIKNKGESTESITNNPSKSRPLNLMAHLNKPDYSELPFHKFAIMSVVVFAYMIFPLPSYLSGFVMGCLITSFGGLVYMWLTKPVKPLEPVPLPPVIDLPPPPVPEMKQTLTSDETSYKGWMNEVAEYKVDDYHINQTHSVFISLEGTHLRLQRPKNPAPKRAMWDENITKPQFIHQRHFDLPGSRVYLFPFGLVKKRIWSKKYPICISFGKGGVAVESKGTSELKHTSSEPLLEAKDNHKSRDMGFEILSDDKLDDILYLFARTGREKEEWFKRFSAAAAAKPLGNHVLDIKRAMKLSPKTTPEPLSKTQREGSVESLNSIPVQPIKTNSEKKDVTHLEGEDLQSFALYMGRLMPASVTTPTSRGSSPTHASNKLPGSQEKEEVPRFLQRTGPIVCDNQLFWVNALIGRCFYDFLRDEWWIGKVTEKLQRKLSKIHVPYFIEELQVTSIDMGYEIPAVRHAGRPYVDERGFWVDLDLTYSGGFKMTIETKINLMKLKKSPHASNSQGHSVDGSKSAITDSDEEDSAESSTDEDEEMAANTSDKSGNPGWQVRQKKKFLRYIDKLTQSRYFQQATEYKVIRRAMENVSNTPLTLTVTVNSLVGKLAVNIPPPPSDRLWYGFRTNPHLRLSAKPQVGERAVTITHVTDWIEKKLAVEFQRVFVMPNMDDLVIPILVPGDTSQRTMSRSSSL